MVDREMELGLLVVGLDDTMMQTVHASRRYDAEHVLWGARHADVLSIADDGAIVLDVRRFHDVEVTEPTEAFPYPR
jgi:inward rectifier potassium channel